MTIEKTRKELIEVLQEWLLIKIKIGDEVPVVAGISLNIVTEDLDK